MSFILGGAKTPHKFLDLLVAITITYIYLFSVMTAHTTTHINKEELICVH